MTAASGADREPFIERFERENPEAMARARAEVAAAASGADRCRCRNLADDSMPPSERIGDTEAKRRGLWSTVDCTLHRPASGADQPTLRDQLAEALCDDAEDGPAWDYAEDYERDYWRRKAGRLFLPLIEAREERAKAEGGAEALEQAANECERAGSHWRNVLARNSAPYAYARFLRARAASLRATTGQPPDRSDVP